MRGLASTIRRGIRKKPRAWRARMRLRPVAITTGGERLAWRGETRRGRGTGFGAIATLFARFAPLSRFAGLASALPCTRHVPLNHRSSITRRAAIAIAALLLLAGNARAQTTAIVTPPPNVLLPNANGVPPGQTANLEGGAYVARADDSSSNWYNPAGLARASTSSVSATGGAYQGTTVKMSAFPDAGGSFTHLPAVVGAVFKPQKGASAWTYGFSVIQSNTWDNAIATQLVTSQAPAQERFGYTAASQFSRIQGSLAAAHDSSGWRYGFALAAEFTSLEKDQTASDSLQTPTGLGSFVGSSHFTGDATHLRLSAGVQRDLTKEWKLGATVRLPGVSIYSAGVATIDGVAAARSQNGSVSLFAPDARFQYKVPLQAAVGLAYVRPRFEAEIAVRASASQSSYSLFSSDASFTTVTDDGRGGPPVTQVRPWPGLTSYPRGFADAAVGGHFVLTDNAVWKLHFGYATNRAPITDQDQVFNAVNLHAITVGLGGQLKHFQASLGLRYEFGTSADTVIHELPNGQPVTTNFSVRNIGAIYSFAYLF